MDKDYVYCTAILSLTGKEVYEKVLNEFEVFAKITEEEKGCISFTVVPMSQKKQEIALWEIWRNEGAFYEHHKMPHTVALAQKNLTVVKIFESSHSLRME